MADVHKDINGYGYDLFLFVDQQAAAIYICGICKKVCKDAVEIAENQDSHAFDAMEGSLFCRQCIQQSNLFQTQFVSSPFLKQRIHNLTVFCPYATANKITPHNRQSEKALEGRTYCEWNGKLSDLSHHIEHECFNKPLRKCPFDCNHSKTQTHLTRHHLKQHQTEHVEILLSVVESLKDQFSQSQNQIKELQNQMDTNNNAHNAQINALKKQISLITQQTNLNNILVDFPPPPPPKYVQRNISSSYITRPMGCISSDFGFQTDHPKVCVIANGRTAICMDTKDNLIEFGPCLITNKPSQKTRTRRRDNSSIDDLFADPSTLNMNDDEDNYNYTARKKKAVKHRRCKSEMHMMHVKHNYNRFVMSPNRLIRLNDVESDKISCWKCYVFIEDCDKCGTIGIAIINATNNAICTLYKNGDCVNMKKQKTNKNGFKFDRGNMVRICMRWSKTECCVSVTNVDNHKSVVMNGFDVFIKFGFVLRSARITVIEQYWQ